MSLSTGEETHRNKVSWPSLHAWIMTELGLPANRSESIVPIHAAGVLCAYLSAPRGLIWYIFDATK